MSYMKQLSGIIDDLVQQPVRRDRWGRYLVLPEGADDKPALQHFSTWLQQASQA